jgi:hypothetical protein
MVKTTTRNGWAGLIGAGFMRAHGHEGVNMEIGGRGASRYCRGRKVSVVGCDYMGISKKGGFKRGFRILEEGT